MKPDVTQLKERLKAVEKKITEVKSRMPAHSVKPGIMAELITLEDEQETLVEQIRQNMKETDR